jgi:hypothetical protein
MEPGVIVAIVLFGFWAFGGFFNLVLNDHSGALDDDNSRPIPLDQQRPKGPDPGFRRDHD